MLKNFLLPAFLLFFLSFNATSIAAQCPGCLVSLPDSLAEDAIFLEEVPDGQSNLFYQNDVSFRLPKTTTPVSVNDPTIPAGITIDKFNIIGVKNLPPGLDWEANQSEYLPAVQTDGCIKICGTPLQTGWYTIEVKLLATIAVIERESSFFVDMYVAPAVTINDGFTMSNFEGCGAVEVSFINNVPSNNRPGFTYTWDFGNGTISNEESPDNQIYDQPGTYYVNYTASIDTIGYFLTKVNVLESDCNDWPNAAPDFVVKVYTDLGVLLYSSEKQLNLYPPVYFDTNVELEAGGNYILEVVDEDSGINGADDQCVLHLFDPTFNGIYEGENWKIEMEILHPVTTVTTTDTITVFPQPEVPGIVATDTAGCPGVRVVYASSINENIQWYKDGVELDGETEQGLEVLESGVYSIGHYNEFGCISFSEEIAFTLLEAPDAPGISSDNGVEFCDEEEAILMSTYTDNNQWFQNDLEIAGETESTLVVLTSGIYTVAYTNAVGCSTSSGEVQITVWENPAEPVFENNENVLSLEPSIVIPNNFTLVWYYNGVELIGENTNTLCIDTPGNYSLVLTDTDTGCSSSYSNDVIFDPAHNCLTTSTEDLSVQGLLIAPNPVEDRLQISFAIENREALELRLYDLQGRLLQSQQLGIQSGLVQAEMNLAELASGLYVLQVTGASAAFQYKIVKR